MIKGHEVDPCLQAVLRYKDSMNNCLYGSVMVSLNMNVFGNNVCFQIYSQVQLVIPLSYIIWTKSLGYLFVRVAPVSSHDREPRSHVRGFCKTDFLPDCSD